MSKLNKYLKISLPEDHIKSQYNIFSKYRDSTISYKLFRLLPLDNTLEDKCIRYYSEVEKFRKQLSLYSALLEKFVSKDKLSIQIQPNLVNGDPFGIHFSNLSEWNKCSSFFKEEGSLKFLAISSYPFETYDTIEEYPTHEDDEEGESGTEKIHIVRTETDLWLESGITEIDSTVWLPEAFKFELSFNYEYARGKFELELLYLLIQVLGRSSAVSQIKRLAITVPSERKDFNYGIIKSFLYSANFKNLEELSISNNYQKTFDQEFNNQTPILYELFSKHKLSLKKVLPKINSLIDKNVISFEDDPTEEFESALLDSNLVSYYKDIKNLDLEEGLNDYQTLGNDADTILKKHIIPNISGIERVKLYTENLDLITKFTNIKELAIDITSYKQLVERVFRSQVDKIAINNLRVNERTSKVAKILDNLIEIINGLNKLEVLDVRGLLYKNNIELDRILSLSGLFRTILKKCTKLKTIKVGILLPEKEDPFKIYDIIKSYNGPIKFVSIIDHDLNL